MNEDWKDYLSRPGANGKTPAPHDETPAPNSAPDETVDETFKESFSPRMTPDEWAKELTETKREQIQARLRRLAIPAAVGIIAVGGWFIIQRI